MRARVLVVDDDRSFSSSVRGLLRRERLDVICAESPSEALAIYAKEKMDFDLLMIDYHFKSSDITGTDLALRIKRENPYQPIIYMTGFKERDILVSMLETGVARQFITKGGSEQSIIAPVMQALSDAGRLRSMDADDSFEDQQQRQADLKAFGLIGRSKSIHAVAQTVTALRKYRSRFLLIGDSGSGKELLAKAFRKPGEPFVAVDCTRFANGQEHFLEADLFGYQKGAYTGAVDSKVGALEMANGGVLFLDEVHHLSLVGQAKLLRTLQEMKYVRLGDTAERSFNVTVVSAAKPVIKTMLALGTFHEDFYFRLARTVIEIPALNARRDDIAPLAKYFVEMFSARHGVTRALHPQTVREFESYSWPGNVRELEGFVEHLVISSQEEVIGPEAFRSFIAKSLHGAEPGPKIEPSVDLNHIVTSVQTAKITEALRLSKTVGEAAQRLSVARTTLNDRMAKLRIESHLYLNKKGS